jgi:L-histidine N-alpha-methyltransferase
MGQRAPAPELGVDAAATLAAFRDEILDGLKAAQKRLSPRFLYDARGSQLFEEICTLPEYYPTRTELGLLRTHAAELAALAGPHAEIVELGAGSSVKARLLLESLREPESYLPVDISAAYVTDQAAEVAAAFPRLAVHPVVADFTRPFSLPRRLARERTLVFFPGGRAAGLGRRAHRRRALARRRCLPRPRRSTRCLQ